MRSTIVFQQAQVTLMCRTGSPVLSCLNAALGRKMIPVGLVITASMKGAGKINVLLLQEKQSLQVVLK